VSVCVRTAHRVALDSPDHLEPRGTALDSSRNRRFNQLFDRFWYGSAVHRTLNHVVGDR
jgi:hypothetical protein